MIGSLRGLPRGLWLLYAGTFLNRFGMFVLPYLVLYLTRQGFSDAQAGLALGGYGLGTLVAAFAGGYLADRIDRRAVIALAMASSAIAMLVLAQVHTLPALLALAVAAGACSEMFRPAATALVIDLCRDDDRLTALAVYRLAGHLGLAAGPVTAGLLAERSFFLVFAGDAATSLAFGLIAITLLPAATHARAPGAPDADDNAPARPAAPPDAPDAPPDAPPARLDASGAAPGAALAAIASPPPRHWLATALADRRFARFLLAALAITAVTTQMDSTLALHVLAAGHPAKTFGLLASINGALIVALEVALTAITRRLAERAVMAAGYLLIGLGFAATGLAASAPAIGLTIGVWTLGEMISAPVASAYVITLAPAHQRGRYIGLLNAAWSLALVIGPPLGTMAFAAGESWLWAACGVIGVGAAVLVLL